MSGQVPAFLTFYFGLKSGYQSVGRDVLYTCQHQDTSCAPLRCDMCRREVELWSTMRTTTFSFSFKKQLHFNFLAKFQSGSGTERWCGD